MAELGRSDLALLARTPLFQGLPGTLALRAAADRRATLAQAARGETIYTPHAFSRSLGAVLSGKVEVRKGELIVSVLEPGDLFGAAALFNDRTDYAAQLTARSPCRLLLLPQELVEELMAASPALARQYIRYLSGRIRFLEQKIDSLIAGTAEERLTRFLRTKVRDGVIPLDCSLTGLAGRLNVSRASLYRALDSLEHRGAIRREGKAIRVLDPKLLEPEP
ncbi:Crp/Fnr family transcriptional regulator [uncultured Pseudoflavonifractor sp.]|uniref:Crp/Fnr family transcriptional regulator n=1 Tax=uncultured Pseudoflavonifractor sp. TaxID=1221379 RepID=UPI0025ED0046|nr:Crp/Fnr family transcriptional regulator [uncultured Pseudoflavonifractor sp.]